MIVEHDTQPAIKRVVREAVVSMANRWDIGELADAYFLHREDDDLVYRSREDRAEWRFRIGWRVAEVLFAMNGRYTTRVWVYPSKRAMIDDGCIFRDDARYELPRSTRARVAKKAMMRL